MKERDFPDDRSALFELNDRIRLLEEKFLYQEQTIDVLNEVVIEQQAQLNSFEDQLLRLKAMLSAMGDNHEGGQDPPPPHY